MTNRFLFYFFLLLLLASRISAGPKDYQKIVKLKETIEGEKLFAQGKYDEALVMLRDAIEKGEERGEPQFYIGSIYELRHDYTRSIPYFEDAVRRELPKEFREATLWKLVLLHRKEENYAEVLTYIDLLQDMGVSHPNLDKFREEAEVSLSPEKIEARQKFNEGRQIITAWEKENPEEKFWDDAPEKNRIEVLQKYEKAISMDEKLRYLNWEIARHYDQMGYSRDAARVFDNIISYSPTDEAYYKRGVIAKKAGDYPKARESFFQALENLKSENLRFFILINLSQVLYATQEFPDGMEKAKEAMTGSQFKEDPVSPGRLLYCLHAGNVSPLPNDLRGCLSSVPEDELKKKDPRALSLYYFARAEVLRGEYLKNKKNELLDASMKSYVNALIPPELRQAPLKSADVKTPVSGYESTAWAVPADWLILHLERQFEFLPKTEQGIRYRYLLLRLYPQQLMNSLGSQYNSLLADAAFQVGRQDEAFQLLKKMDRNLTEELTLLDILLAREEFEEFQKEVMDFSEKNHHMKDELKTAIESRKMMQFLPKSTLRNDFRHFWGIEPEEDQPPVNPETLPEEKAE